MFSTWNLGLLDCEAQRLVPIHVKSSVMSSDSAKAEDGHAQRKQTSALAIFIPVPPASVPKLIARYHDAGFPTG
ncbi:hypothetical protein [Aquabacter cavernae]|uniref:hypothetical protein n=1 Tax=Aquabacter cavernae TaxID=2496029 RepID=UPI00196A8FAE|nr:hypothetical protein [Aquabacter cavernae]